MDSAILLVSPILISWIEIYPVESAFQCLNNRGLVEMSFICIRITNHYHINDFALSHVLKQSIEATRKLPIEVSPLQHPPPNHSFLYLQTYLDPPPSMDKTLIPVPFTGSTQPSKTNAF